MEIGLYFKGCGLLSPELSMVTVSQAGCGWLMPFRSKPGTQKPTRLGRISGLSILDLHINPWKPLLWWKFNHSFFDFQDTMSWLRLFAEWGNPWIRDCVWKDGDDDGLIRPPRTPACLNSTSVPSLSFHLIPLFIIGPLLPLITLTRGDEARACSGRFPSSNNQRPGSASAAAWKEQPFDL